MDPVLMANAHRAAIAALEQVGDVQHAEVLRVQGTECLRLARLGQSVHDAKDSDAQKHPDTHG